jgi:Glycosyl transferases group 1/Methyltransferase domain
MPELPEPELPAPEPPDPELLRRIPLSARTVLQVGCTSGDLAAAYRRMNPKVRLLGLVADAEAANALAPFFDQITVAGPTDQPLSLDQRLDCIIYDHCLEQMADPLKLLHRHAEALSADGMMLIKVVNAEHWRHAARLLGASTADNPAAMLTPPPPPLFTLDRLREALLSLGLNLCDVTLEETASEEADGFVRALAPALEALGVNPADYAARATTAYYIWRVRKTAGERIIVSGSMLDPIGGVSHVRVVHPLAAIGTNPLTKVAVLERIGATPPEDETPRIFVLHRPALISEAGTALLRALRIAGYLLVTEFDDHPDHFNMMQHGGELSFRGVHALQTSTPTLARVLRKYNPEIAVFPNAIATLPEIHNFRDPDKMTLFFGALNREHCWQPLMDVLNTVARMAGPRLRFQVVHDKLFFEALDTPHKAFMPTCDYETYLHLLGASELCFMPLSDTPFNRAKSDLKYIECGACRVTPVASTVVYGDSIQHDRTGLLFRDETELYNSLLRLLATPDTARVLADAGRKYVEQNRMLAYQVEPRLAWYRSLWKRRAELTAALDARMASDFSAAA